MMNSANGIAFDGVKSGRGELKVEMVAGESAVVTARASSPLKILVPCSRGQSVSACFSSYGGGLVAGDEISVGVELGDGARCYLSTQASTKVYRNPGLLPCGQTLTARAGQKSRAGAGTRPGAGVQRFALSAAAGILICKANSGLILVDWLTSGRTARGERWAFSRYESRNEIFVSGKRLAGGFPVADPVRMARSRTPNAWADLIVWRCSCCWAERWSAPAAWVLEAIAADPSRGAQRWFAVPARWLAGHWCALPVKALRRCGKELHRLLDFLPEVLHDDQRLRKW